MRRLFLILIFLTFYFFRFHQVSSQQINIPPDTQVKVTAWVSQQPYLSASKQIIRLGQFLVVTEAFPTYFYGQKLEIIGKPTQKVIGKFQKQFVFNYPTIRVLSEEESLINQRKIIRFLFSFRQQLENIFSNFLPEPQASLLSGIVLGSKKQIPYNFTQNLRKTGTIHLVVASGYNVTVVAGFLVAFLTKFIRRQVALIIAVLGVLVYTLMAGAEPPIVRAAIMGILTYLAQFLGREKDALNCLVFAAAVMLFFNPLILFDIGFQLSFLATAGILLIGPRLPGKIFQIPLIGENLRTTLAAQAGVLPILLNNFGQISFLSPFINVLILPLVPLIMTLGAITSLFGLIWQPLAQIASWLVWVPLTVMVEIINSFANFSLSSAEIGKISGWLVVGYYGILGVLIVKSSKLKFKS